MTKKNIVKDFSKYVGYDLTKKQYIILESERQIHSTTNWNPLTFALVFEKQVLADYILDEINFNVAQLLDISLKPEIDHQYFDGKEDLTNG